MVLGWIVWVGVAGIMLVLCPELDAANEIAFHHQYHLDMLIWRSKNVIKGSLPFKKSS